MFYKRIYLLSLLFTCFAMFAEFNGSYVNPILDKTMPDPTVVDDGQGNFYMYATNMAKKVPIYTSRDLVNWIYCGDSFTVKEMPTGLEGGGIWAPDVIRYKNSYLMAYSYSKGGEYHNNGIGLAIADSPKGPFKNLGLLFTSDSSGVRNSIDPSLVLDGGKLYLLWGSFNGLYIVELSRDKSGGFYIKDH